jgi:hypothetical protein
MIRLVTRWIKISLLSLTIPTVAAAWYWVQTGDDPIVAAKPHNKMRGVTFVAPPREVDSMPFVELKKLGTESIALVPYGFTREGEATVHHNSDLQWWGERIQGIESCILMAHSQGMKVMLKPQVWSRHQWIGEMSFGSRAEWDTWHKTYRDYIMSYVQLAVKHKVDMVCVGTEVNISAEQYPEFWVSLIAEIRQIYGGKLTYSANWDHYEKISFWDKLDYVGVSAYFPLNDAKTPEITKLVKAWKPVVRNLNAFSAKVKKPLLFTEYGYLAVDGAAGKTWELEEKMRELPINERAQANAYEAIWQAWHDEKMWEGGFLWKWFPNGLGHEGQPRRDYTPQGKEAEQVLKNWFTQARI